MNVKRNACAYAPLLVKLAFYWQTPFEKLPPHLKPLVSEAYKPYYWQDLTPEGRLQIAANLDKDNDPDREPVLRFSLDCLKSELQEQIEKVREKDKDAAALALEDLAKKIDKILSEEDREGVGEEIKQLGALPAEIQAFRQQNAELVAANEKLHSENDALGQENAALQARLVEIQPRVWDGFDDDSDNYPPELDIAMQAWRAVTHSPVDASLTPKDRIVAWLSKCYPKLSGVATERIKTVCNWDKTPGRKRRIEK
jgi:hypothetical protein